MYQPSCQAGAIVAYSGEAEVEKSAFRGPCVLAGAFRRLPVILHPEPLLSHHAKFDQSYASIIQWGMKSGACLWSRVIQA